MELRNALYSELLNKEEVPKKAAGEKKKSLMPFLF
jgi:hypothetical protein